MLYNFYKRLFDIIIALLGIIICLPLFLLISVLIKIDSKGPIFFKQSRVGQHSVDFILVKFRTMTDSIDAEQGQFEPGNASRVTRMGRMLRKVKLDELPQLINVLKGNMSFVGPRPEVRKWVNKYQEQWKFIHTVKPGITDPASIAYRNEEEILQTSLDPELKYEKDILPHKLSMYTEYVKNRSFIYDFSLIVKTIAKILLRAH